MQFLKNKMVKSEITKNQIRNIIKTESPLVLEIGANDGKDSLEFLKTFRHIKLHCFEPDPRQIRNFESNIQDNRCKLYKIALSNKRGKAEFYMSDSKDPSRVAQDSSSLKKPKEHLKRFPWVKFDEKIVVKTDTLDNWAEEKGIKEIDFIWADVQGAEKELFEGGINTLNNKTRYLYTEFYNKEIYEGQLTLKGILKKLPNFKLVKIYGNNALLENINLKKRYVVSAAQGGLSNRIKCIVSSMKIAKETKKELLLYWPKNEGCNSSFKDLFDNKISEIKKEELLEMMKSGKKGCKFLVRDSSLLDSFGEKDIFGFETKLYEKKKEIIEYLSEIKIKKDVLNLVEKFYRENLKNKIIGIHIRRGDFLKIRSGIWKISPEEGFIEEIRKEISLEKQAKFFLATDDLETEKRIKSLFGERIITYPKKEYNRDKENSVKEALIELILLSKTKKIIGTYGSSFTEMAWFFGRCKPEIKIVIDKHALRKYLEYQNKEKRNIINKMKKFVYELFFPKSKRFFRVKVK